MANIKVRVAAVTGAARSDFHLSGFARPDRAISNGVGPHILRLPQPSAGKRTFERRLERVEVAVAVIIFDLELPELRERPFPRGRIDEIDLTGAKQLMPFAADVTDLGDKAVR